MTRWRKEVIKKIEDLEIQQKAEYEMSCGFFASEIAETFKKNRDKLEGEWARTYGKTRIEYEEMMYAIQPTLCEADVIPFC